MANTLVAANMGSISHGTYVPSSDPQHIDDVDILMILVPPAEALVGLDQFDHWVWLKDELDVVSYSARKLAHLMLKGNPNVLGLMWLPDSCVLKAHPLWKNWLENRRAFLGPIVHKSFAGYAYSQLHRLGSPNTRGYMGRERKELFQRYGYDLKNAAHCLRLLRMGCELMETGDMHVDRTDIDAAELIEVKAGGWTLGQVQREAERGFKRMQQAAERSMLPEHPDLERVERLLVDTTLTFWKAM
jgi:predicted nucleotidyltransferase